MRVYICTPHNLSFIAGRAVVVCRWQVPAEGLVCSIEVGNLVGLVKESILKTCRAAELRHHPLFVLQLNDELLGGQACALAAQALRHVACGRLYAATRLHHTDAAEGT